MPLRVLNTTVGFSLGILWDYDQFKQTERKTVESSERAACHLCLIEITPQTSSTTAELFTELKPKDVCIYQTRTQILHSPRWAGGRETRGCVKFELETRRYLTSGVIINMKPCFTQRLSQRIFRGSLASSSLVSKQRPEARDLLTTFHQGWSKKTLANSDINIWYWHK